MLIRPHIRLLHDVFRLRVVPQNCKRDPVDSLIVAAHQDFIERGISRTGQADQFFIRVVFPIGEL
jgi:hypothetical protein